MDANPVNLLVNAKPLYITKLTASTTVVSPVLELLRSCGVNFICSLFTSFSDTDIFFFPKKLQWVVLTYFKRQTKCQVTCLTKIFTDTQKRLLVRELGDLDL